MADVWSTPPTNEEKQAAGVWDSPPTEEEMATAGASDSPPTEEDTAAAEPPLVEAPLPEQAFDPELDSMPLVPVEYDPAQDNEEEEQRKDADVRALREAIPADASRAAGAYAIAEKTGLDVDHVLESYDELRQSLDDADFDARQWRKDNAHLWYLFNKHPKLAPVLMKQKGLGEFSRLMQAVESYGIGDNPLDPLADRLPFPLSTGVSLAGEALGVMFPLAVPATRLLTGTATPPPEEGPPEFAEYEDKTDVGVGGVFADAFTKQIKGAGLSVLGDKQLALDAAVLLAEETGVEPVIEAARNEAEQNMLAIMRAEQDIGLPSYYGDGLARDTVATVAEALGSQAINLGSASAGALAVGGVTLAATRSPAAAGAAATTAAKVFASAASFVQETGSFYVGIRDAKDDDDRPIDRRAAMGFAVLYGAGASAIEFASMGPMLKAFGISGAMGKGQANAALRQAMSDVTTRAILADIGKAWLKSGVAEGGEEAAQSFLEDVLDWSARSVSAGSPQKFNLTGSLDKALESGIKGGVGSALGLGPLQAGSSLIAKRSKLRQARDAGNKIAAIAKLADSDIARAAPKEVAELIEIESAKNGGEKITSIYIDPVRFTEEVTKLGGDPGRVAMELMGGDGAARLRQAITERDDSLGNRATLEVPVSEVLERWGGKPFFETLKQDIATRPGGYTVREGQDVSAKTDEMVKKILAEEMEQDLAEVTSPSIGLTEGERAFIDAAEKQLVETQQANREQARQQIAVWRAFVRTMAEAEGRPIEEAFAEMTLTIQRVRSQSPASVGAIYEMHKGMVDDTARAQALFTDFNTGLYNLEGMELAPRDASRQFLAEFDLEGGKFLNDRFGHESVDGAFRLMAQTLRRLGVHDGGKVGGSIRAFVRDQDHAREIAQAMREAIDPNLRITYAVAPRGATVKDTIEDTSKAHKEVKSKLGAERKLGHRKGAPAAFMQDAPKIDFDNLRNALPEGSPELADVGIDPESPQVQALLGDAAKQMAPIAERLTSAPAADGASPVMSPHMAAFAKMDSGAAFRATYLTQSGLLNANGWREARRLNPKPFVVSADLRAFREMNDAFGREEVDALNQFFGEVVAGLGGGKYDAAHVSGDEYRAQFDTEAEATKFFETLRRVTDDLVFLGPHTNTGSDMLQDGLSFAYGKGRDDDEADRINLPVAKREQDERGAVSTPRGAEAAAGQEQVHPGGVGAGDGSPQRGIRERTKRSGLRGTRFVELRDLARKRRQARDAAAREGRLWQEVKLLTTADRDYLEKKLAEIESAEAQALANVTYARLPKDKPQALRSYRQAFDAVMGASFPEGRDQSPSEQADSQYRRFKDGRAPMPPPFPRGPFDRVNDYLDLKGDKQVSGLAHAFDALMSRSRGSIAARAEETIAFLRANVDGLENLTMPDEYVEARAIEREAEEQRELAAAHYAEREQGQEAAAGSEVEVLDTQEAVPGEVDISDMAEVDESIELDTSFNFGWYNEKSETTEQTEQTGDAEQLLEQPRRRRPSPGQMPLQFGAQTPQTAEAAIDRVEDEIRGLPHERVVVIDQDGKEIARIDGSEDRVAISQAVADTIRNNGNAIFTHNHPSGFTLSPEDIVMAVYGNVKEMRATMPDGGTWILRRPASGWGVDDIRAFSRRVRAARNQAVDMARRRMDRTVLDAGGNPADGSNATGYSNERWKEFVDEHTNESYADLAVSLGAEWRVERESAEQRSDRLAAGTRQGLAADVRAEPRNLVVVHNLTAENLLHAQELGGLAAPSIAISRKEHPLENFGEISLIGGSDLVDPKTGTPVFDADVYSPRWPRTRWKLSKSGVKQLREFIKPYAEQVSSSSFGFFDEDELAKEGPEGTLSRYQWREALGLAFLDEKGKAPELKMKPAGLRFDFSRMPALVEFFKERGIDRNFAHGDEYGKALSEAAKKAIHQWAEEVAIEDGEPDLANDIANDWIDKNFDEDGNFFFGRSNALLDDAKKVGATVVDTSAMGSAVREAIDTTEMREEFDAWALDKLKPAFADRFIAKWNNGGWRHTAYTMENVLKELTRKIRQGEDFNYGLGTARSAGAKKFRSLEQIKKARDKITSKKEFDEAKEAMTERFAQLANEFRRYHPAQQDRLSFGSLDALAMAVGDSFKRGKGMWSALRDNGYQDVPSEAVAELAEFARDLLAMPTEYFEAKPQRAVQLSEFKGAVVPKGTRPEVLDAIKGAGLQVVEYDKDDSEARQRAIEQFAEQEELLFQEAFHGTPHRDIDRFSLDAIGTGEGAQAYGWGLYFTQKKEIAEFYRRKLAGRPKVTIDGKDADGLNDEDGLGADKDPKRTVIARLADRARALNELGHEIDPVAVLDAVVTDIMNGLTAGQNALDFALEAAHGDRLATRVKSAQRVVDSLTNQLREAQDLRGKDIAIKEAGQVHKVDIPESDELLDHDATLINQPPGVIEKLEAAGILPDGKRIVEVMRQYMEAKDRSGPAFDALVSELTKHHESNRFLPNGERYDGATKGRDIYRAIAEGRGGQKRASEILRDAGIPGLRYLDGMSRPGGDGTHNFVIWNEEAIKTLETLYQRPEPWFSAVERAVTEAKQEKNTPQAWLAAIKKTSGVRAEELEWLGLEPWLAKQKGSLTREQVNEYVRAHAVRIEEREKGAFASEEDTRAVTEAYSEASGTWEASISGEIEYRTGDGGRETFSFDGDTDIASMYGDLRALEQQVADLQSELEDVRQNQADEDTPEGAAEYDDAISELEERLANAESDLANAIPEHVLDEAMNQVEREKDDAEAAENAAARSMEHWRRGEYSLAVDEARDAAYIERKRRGSTGIWGDFADAVEQAAKRIGDTYEDYTLGGHKKGSYRELLFYAPGTPSEKFEAPHFDDDGKGLIAHARISEHATKDGKRVLFVEEVQSDLHQEAREKGYERRDKPRGDTSTFLWDFGNLKPPPEGSDADSIAKRFGNDRDATVDVNGVTIEDAAMELRTDPADRRFRRKDVERDRGYDRVFEFEDGTFLIISGRQWGVSAADRRDDSARPQTLPPQAPFKTTWDEFAAKRLLRMAAEEGHDVIGWTTGDQQAERYDLSKKVSKLSWRREKAPDGRELYALTPYAPEGGRISGLDQLFSADELPGVVGADLARKIVESKEQSDTIGGTDLKLGGEGMRQAYDRRMVSVFRDLTKKHGGTIEKQELENGQTVWTVTVPESLRNLVLERGQPLFQPGEEATRGWVRIATQGMRRAFNVFLTERADLSTFMHESAHIYFEMVGDLAQHPQASDRIKKDWARILKFVGAKDRASLTTEQKEKFARAFEAYLREGKAPSTALAEAFQAFRLWLTEIYRSLAILNVELDDEIRGVFDRLLATDAEIKRMQAVSGLDVPLFRSHIEAGISAAEWEKYLELRKQSVTKANMRLQRQMYDAQLRATEAFKSAEFKKFKEQAAEEWKERKDWQAWRYLLTGERLIDGKVIKEPNFGKLDRAEVRKILGDDHPLERKLHGRLVKKGGRHPGEIADVLGFTSGRAMLDAIDKMPERDTWIQERAEALMREKHPEIDGELARLSEAAQRALHNEGTSEWLLKEWAALKRRQGNLEETPAPLEAVKLAAKQLTDARKIRKLDPGMMANRERGAAERAARAAAKGDWKQAFVHKQKQLLYHFMWKELDQASADRDAFLGLAGDLSADKARARLGKAGVAYRDVVDTLLERLGLAEERQQDVPRLGLGDLLNAMEENGDTVAFDLDAITEVLAKPMDWRELSVAKMREVLGALKNIKKAATNRNTAIVNGRRVDRDELVSDLLAEAEALSLVNKDKTVASSEAATTMVQRGLSLGATFDGYLLKPQTMIAWLGGDKADSLWYRAIVDPLQKAKQREADILRKTVRPLLDAFDKLPKSTRARLREPIPGRELFPGHRDKPSPPSIRLDLIMLALHRGNESSLERLTAGRGITTAQVDAALSLLTKEELDWIQSVWDAAESLWPLSRDLEERDAGLAPPKIPALPFTVRLADGTTVQMRGGYFPAVYDPRVTQVGKRQFGADEAGLFDPTYTRPGTSRSHLKRRVEGFADVLSLDPGVIQSHLMKVAHDIAFREPLRSVASVIMDPRIHDALLSYLGKERADTLLPWLKDIGRMEAASSDVHAGQLGTVVRRLRSNMVIGTLGWAVDNFVGDLTNVLVAPIKSDLKAKNIGKALFAFMKDRGKLRAFALEKSGELRYRGDKVQQDLDREIKAMARSQSLPARAIRWYKDHAFWIAEQIDVATATPIWFGAYAQALDEGRSDADAVSFADNVLQQTLPSFSVVDKSAVQRDKGLIGASVSFYGYMNVLYNLERRIWQGSFRSPLALTKAIGQHVALLVVAGAFAEFLIGRGPEPGDGEDDDERWLNWMMRKMLVANLAPVPWVGGAIESLFLGKEPSVRSAPMFSVLNTIGRAGWRAWKEGGDGVKEAWDMARAAGLITGIPTRHMRAGHYLTNLALDEAENKSAAGVASGIIYGERPGQPLNPITAAEGALAE